MPLFDSLSTAQSYRLPKMNSVPTTDDLRYAISEAQKRVGKTIELPFEHPNNHQLFIVKLLLSVGNKVPPSWTLQRGDGPSAIRLWNRAAEDCLMIQNKIKIDSQQVPVDGEQVTQVASQPMSLQVSIGGGAPDLNNPFTIGTPGGGSDAVAAPGAAIHSSVQQENFYAQSNQQAINAFSAPPQMAPDVSDSWMNNLVQPPAFKPGASKTNMPALHPGTAAAVVPAQRAEPTLPAQSAPVPDDYEFNFSQPEPQTTSQNANAVPLPPPIKLDTTLIEKVHSSLLDGSTGMITFPGFVYFLFREFENYRKCGTPLSVVVFEVALRIGNENVALPGVALQAIVERIQNVTSEFDIITHLSGGEFAALLAGVDSAGATEFASALHAAVTSEPLVAGSRNESVLAAIGMGSIPQTCNDPEVLIAAARQAKETAKSMPHPILLFPS
jgi:hypothetical protein